MCKIWTINNHTVCHQYSSHLPPPRPPGYMLAHRTRPGHDLRRSFGELFCRFHESTVLFLLVRAYIWGVGWTGYTRDRVVVQCTQMCVRLSAAIPSPPLPPPLPRNAPPPEIVIERHEQPTPHRQSPVLNYSIVNETRNPRLEVYQRSGWLIFSINDPTHHPSSHE